MSNTEVMVEKVSSYLRRAASRRSNRSVTADDVQNYLDNSGYRGDTNSRLSIVNSVLRKPAFKPTGFVPSNREAARGRMIREWRITR